jgi:hypothetical protein
VRGTRDLHWLVPQSVYQRVLGDEFDRLAPELRAYFSAPPADSVGRGHGVYEVAGSHKRWLAPLFAFLAWRRILFPELGYGVPFTVTNIPGPGEGLSSRREFHLPGRERQMHDTMHVVDGSLHDFLGRRGGLEVRLRPTVGDDGSLHLRALRVPLPALLSARVLLDESWVDGRQRVDVRMQHPLFGEIFRYCGAFDYHYETLG